jgi:uncharacterized membrane protein YjfL (UPF0719 family)
MTWRRALRRHFLFQLCWWESFSHVLLALRRQARRIEEGHVASAVMVATISFAVGLLNAVSISH